MFTTGSKYFFGFAAFAFLAACFYGGASAGNEIGLESIVGVLTLGYKGAVGDHIGYSVLMSLAAVSAFLGCVTVATRDAGPEAEAEVAGLDVVPEPQRPQGSSFWPVVGAFGAGLVAMGLAISDALVVIGLGLLAATTFEWAIKAWSERATGDPAVNRAIRNRIMYPVEVPVLAAVSIAVFVLAISRLLLAVPEIGAYLIFGGVPALILVVGWFFTTRPRLNRSLVTAVLVLGGVAVLAGGVIGAASGTREIEEHHEEEGEGGQEGADSEGAGEGESLAPLPADATRTTVILSSGKGQGS